jgi:hypothetical protein
MKTFLHLWQCLAEFFLEWELFEKSCRENQNILFWITVFQKSCRLWLSKNVVEPETACQYGGALHAE